MSLSSPHVPLHQDTDLLDARERALVRLAANGLSVEEIGQLLGLHPVAVRCLTRAIRDALADPIREQRETH
jgi:DNA-binding NarL/FixJ family response regulator